MSDNPKEAQKEMEKAIFISADCWLSVFDLLPRSQLGLRIAMISHRFDYFVDEHFKTRKWTLDKLEIRSKIGENGAKEMEIVNSDGEELPIMQNPLPSKFIGFRGISITYFDHNVLTFLRRFHLFFTKCETKLTIATANVRISEFAVLNIWPLFKDSICQMDLNKVAFQQMRQFAPSILCNCASLQIVTFFFDILPEFPPDDSANASDGQAVAKWLFSPHPDNLPKQFFARIWEEMGQQWLAIVEQIKAEFSIASSPVSFGISVSFMSFVSLPAIGPFKLTNPFTGEKLTLWAEEIDDENCFVLIRCPIGRDERKWDKQMDEFIARKKQIELSFNTQSGVDKGLLDGARSFRKIRHLGRFVKSATFAIFSTKHVINLFKVNQILHSWYHSMAKLFLYKPAKF